MTATLAAWATVAGRVGATRKRLQKTAELVGYGTSLDDADLALATRFFAGQVFPPWDPRVLQVGQALLLRVLAELAQQPEADLKRQLVTLGDLGDLARAVLPDTSPTLTLRETFEALAGLVALRQAATKRQALQHLLNKATPEEARYLVGLMLGDLRIGLKESLVEEALATAYQVDVRAVQWANMLRGDIGATALLARHGRLAEARMVLFHPLKPMLASPVESLASITAQMTGGCALEDKYDGIRAQVHLSERADPGRVRGTMHEGVRVAMFSRTHADITDAFADLIPALASLLRQSKASELLLDGEILAVRGERVLPFSALQTRLGRRKPDSEAMQATPVAFVAFDILAWGDTVLLQTPYTERRTHLTRLKVDGTRVRITTSTVMQGIDDVELAFTQARARGNEGLIIKALGSTYTPGRRGREWLKVKRPQATLDVVITAAEVGHGKRRTVLSDYTFAVRAGPADATLLDIGKAYSGLTDAEILALTAVLKRHTIDISHHGKQHTVEPSVVVEITFDLVQRSRRYPSGYALRFPRIVRLRPDKGVGDIDTLQAVAELCPDDASES